MSALATNASGTGSAAALSSVASASSPALAASTAADATMCGTLYSAASEAASAVLARSSLPSTRTRSGSRPRDSRYSCTTLSMCASRPSWHSLPLEAHLAHRSAVEPDAHLEELVVLLQAHLLGGHHAHAAHAEHRAQLLHHRLERLRRLLLRLPLVHREQVGQRVGLEQLEHHRAEVAHVDGGQQVAAVADARQRQRLAVPRRLEQVVEQVLVLPVDQPRGDDVRAQPGPLALGHELLKREQLLEAAVGAAALVLLLGQRLLRLLRVGRRPRPRHYRRDPNEHLLVLKLLDAADRLEQGLGAVHRVQAVEHRQFALAEGREQRLGRGVDHPLHPARLLSGISKGAEDLEFLVLAGEEAFAKDLPSVLAGVQDEDLARRSRVLLVAHAALLWAAALWSCWRPFV